MAFRLSQDFLGRYDGVRPPFGFVDESGTSLGEITFLRSYSRVKPDGTKETWQDTCQRVIEGMFTIQETHARTSGRDWDAEKARNTAEDAYDRLFNLKWTPPGRGLAMMGTPLVVEQMNGGPLQSCAFVSTNDLDPENPGRLFAWIMEASMFGVGVGFDGAGAGDFRVHAPEDEGAFEYVIPDSREGWSESLRLMINSYLLPNMPKVTFNYDLIRPYGTPIKTFGGTASGPGPLIDLHEKLRGLMNASVGEMLSITRIADIGNLIAVCVVSGNVRRSAEIFLSDDIEELMSLKDYESQSGQARGGWSWASNNTVVSHRDRDLSRLAAGIYQNGEPGVIWMDNARQFGRMNGVEDTRDADAQGTNPCGEQILHSWEVCTLSETYPSRHDSLEDYLATLKIAYLYGKTVTLLTTPWPETNAIVERNRRVGCSMSGVSDLYDRVGAVELERWMETGYARVQELDESLSEWMGVPRSIRTTSVKPSGSVSLLAGVSPGVHWAPGTKHYFRLMRVGKGDPLVEVARQAGYRIEDAATDPNGTAVIYFPMVRPTQRGEHDVELNEKFNLARLAARHWADNAVSVTLSFKPEEKDMVNKVLEVAPTSLKTVSFLPLVDHGYVQAPYTPATTEDIEITASRALPMDLTRVYGNGVDAEIEQFCTTDKCEVK